MRGYRTKNRVAGSKHPNFSSKDLKEIAFDLDYRKFLDPGPMEAVPVVGPLWALFRGTGLYRGDYAHEWIAEKLRDLGVETFEDLRIIDDSLPEPRWPTFGITVLPNLPAGNDDVIPGLGRLRFIGGVRLLSDLPPTMLVGRDQAHLNQPWVSARAIRVDSTDVGVLDFDISDEAKEALYRKGYDAAVEFLRTWDWPKYLERFRAVPVRK